MSPVILIVVLLLVSGCGDSETASLAIAKPATESYSGLQLATCEMIETKEVLTGDLAIGWYSIQLVGDHLELNGAILTSQVISLRHCDLILDETGEIFVEYKKCSGIFSSCVNNGGE